MKLNNKWLFLAAFFVLALPILLTAGNAGAVYYGDGAVRGDDGRLYLPEDIGACWIQDGLNSGSFDDTKTDKTACRAVTISLDQTTCTSASPDNSNWKGRWVSSSSTCTGNWVFSSTYTGSHQWCLRCHNSAYMGPGSTAAKETYLDTGHRNMVRKVTPGIPLGDVNYQTGASDVPYASIDWATGTLKSSGDVVQYIWGGWWKNNVVNAIATMSAASPSTKTESGTYACASCHTTGYVATDNVAGMEPENSFPGITGVTGSWVGEGIQCERCHKTQAEDGTTADEHHGAVAEGTESTALCAECHTQEIDTFPQIKAGNHGAWSPAAIDGHSRTSEFLQSPHAKFYGDEEGIGEPDGVTSKYNSHFTGGTCYTDSTMAQTQSKYPRRSDCEIAGYYWKGSSDYNAGNGGCINCHNVHYSAVDTDADLQKKAVANRCGVNCHTGDGGFHDSMTDPNAPKTNTGSVRHDPSYDDHACVQCHMGDRRTHIFRNSVDANYFEFPTKAQFDAGQKTLIVDPNAVDGYNDADGNPAAVSNSIDTVCMQCHHAANSCSDSTYTTKTDCQDAGRYWYTSAGKGKAFSSKKAVASGLSGNYHEMPKEFTASTTDDCLQCHADKDTFLKTGHYNTARPVTAGETLYGPDGGPLSRARCGVNGDEECIDWGAGTYIVGACKDPDGNTTGDSSRNCKSPNVWDATINVQPMVLVHHSWFEGDGTHVITTGADNNNFACAPCHTTGFDPNGGGAIKASTLGITVGSNSSYFNDPFTVTAGSWDEWGIQCSRCHGKNNEANTHTASMPKTAADNIALCGECHLQKHHALEGFLNSPHARFSGTPGELADSTKYDSYFVKEGNGCTACHDVHKSTIEAANPDGGAVKDCTECHTGQYGKDLGLHQLITSDAAPKKCYTCHVPEGMHYFRINPDPDYKTGDAYTDSEGNTLYAVSIVDACQQCHKAAADGGTAGALTVEQLASYAKVYHTGTYQAPARFNWYKGSGCNVVTFDASMNTASSFDWTFGDNSKGTGSVINHTFPAAGNYSVTLALNDGRTRTMVVTASGINQVPTTGMTVEYDTTDSSGMTLKVTDGSSANSCGASSTSGTATILWGDGSVDVVATTINTTSTTHKYTVKGTYTIRYAFRDSNNNKAMAEPVTKSVPSDEVGGGLYTVSGVVTYKDGECVDVKAGDGACGSNTRDIDLTGQGVSNATIYIKTASDSIIKIGKSGPDGSFSISGVQGGQDLKVIAVKTGVNFDPVEIDLNLSADSTSNTFVGTLAY